MTYNKDNPLRVAELFAGYGSQRMALQRLKEQFPGFDYKVVLISEIEPWALAAYEAVHGDCPNVGDISKVDWDKTPDFDLATWSFPCTDISQAGQQKGLSEDSGTHSSLAWEALRCFRAKRPKFLLMENVAALVSKKFMPDFLRLQKELENMGYKNFWSKLNAVDFDCPQNRLRVFMVSILDQTDTYEFPAKMPLTKCLADVLEQEVDESYYLKSEYVDRILAQMKENNNVKI